MRTYVRIYRSQTCGKSDSSIKRKKIFSGKNVHKGLEKMKNTDIIGAKKEG